MKKKAKIHAFTLSELLVVLVISSIVVTLSFLALSNVQRQVRAIHLAFEKQQKIVKLERLLSMDLNKREAFYDEGKNTLLFANATDTIVYQFTKDKVYREKDSMDLSCENKQFYLDGNQVVSGAVDALEFSFSDTYSEKGFFVFKRKDASYYINQ